MESESVPAQSTPLLTNAELWSKKYSLEFLEQFSYQNSDFKAKFQSTPFDSFIAVLHRSPVYDASELPASINHLKLARKSAIKALAALHFVVMSNASPQNRCILADSLPTYLRWDTIADRQSDEVFHFLSSMDLGESVVRSRAQLMEQFNDPRQAERRLTKDSRTISSSSIDFDDSENL
ncbi:MAG: hypothetical protein K2X93_15695 [Candidatus Obscuribacterales bacterium]|nr:hypothetical protein [Candidatus Obscuribacterales bacterium]